VLPILLATTFNVHPFELVRVTGHHPDAIATSETSSVLTEPPGDGWQWQYEAVAHMDGWVAPEAIDAMNVDLWHAKGARGAGVKLAIFDPQWFGATIDPEVLGEVFLHDCFANKACPTFDPLAPRFEWEEGIHGYACAEVVRAIAPEVELHLVRVNGTTSLENAVAWAIREDIDVISMSLSFFNQSFYDGTGYLNEWMAELDAAGILLLTSAGNYARGHWDGTYTDGDDDGRMDFDGDNRIRMFLGQGVQRAIYVNWDQHGRCGSTDLDAYLYTDDGQLLARGENTQRQALEGEENPPSCEPMERLTAPVEQAGWHWLEVRHRRGNVSSLRVDVMATAARIEGTMPQASIADPGASPHVLTIGAVDAEGYLTNGIESFSSQGPSRGGFGKPELAGPDGLTTHGYGARGFFGTSAATPAVTAALAVVMSNNPELTPRQAAQKLQAWAWQGDITHPDPRWGAGKVRLPPEPMEQGCGRQPLLALVLVLPFAWFRRIVRRRRRS
jgi:hypothetical protein